ncbi:MAG: hypothetical protein WC314_10940 [Vulcanimicrobiota bacterium]
MAKIPVQNTNLQQAKILRNKQRQLQTDVANAKTTNATTLGRQTNRTADDKKTETPREKVTISTPPTVQEQTPQTESQDAPEVQSRQSGPREKSSEDLKTDFLNSFADNLDENSASEIAKKTGESMVEIANSGGGSDAQAEPVLAAHTHNHAKSIINKKMPNATAAEIQEAAKTDPEIAKAVALMDSSAAYMKQVVKEKTEGAPATPSEPGVPGDSSQAGPPDESAQGVDPFAARRASMEGQQPPSDSDGTQPPGEGPQNPYHLSPEKQAELMAQNHQSMQEIQKIYAQMWADMQKAAAQRHQIMQETALAVSEIYMSLHAKRAASFSKHHQMYLSILTDSWG